MTYAQKLRDPRWQRKRLEVMEAAEFSCAMCGSADRQLHVHHRIYRKGCEPWEYASHELECLCEECHEGTTTAQNELKEALAQCDPGDLQAVVGYAKAVAAAANPEFDCRPADYEQAWGLAAYLHANTEQVIRALPKGKKVDGAWLAEFRKGAK